MGPTNPAPIAEGRAVEKVTTIIAPTACPPPLYKIQAVECLAAGHEDFSGYKDALGSIERLAKVYARDGGRIFYFGSLPTAETCALPLLQLGPSRYSSAICNFVLEFALEFYADVRAQNYGAAMEKLHRFVLPYLKIRYRGARYGVSIVKAVLKAIGRECGSVRPPLRNLFDQDQEALETLLRPASVIPAAL